MRPSSRWMFLAASPLAQPASADWTLNMTPGVTEISREVYDLHMLIFWVCVAIGVVVFSVFFYAIIRHRKSRGVTPHSFHEHPGLEILWTLIPVAILLAMAVPSAATLVKMYDKDDADLSIRITGYQWKWRYSYIDDEVDFFSTLTTPQAQIDNETDKGEHYLLEVDRPLVIPAGKKVRFLLTSNDVIHSWWVPALAVKKDAIPGFINEAWTRAPQPGTYRGQCAELCGRMHGFMPIVVEVKSEADYRQWLAGLKAESAAQQQQAERSWTRDELVARGERVYQQSCAACHQANGEGIANVFPALKGSPMVNGPADAHVTVVAFGRSNTAMQAFGEQLSPVDLAAVITYERSAWGNDGTTVTPQMIQQTLGKE